MWMPFDDWLKHQDEHTTKRVDNGDGVETLPWSDPTPGATDYDTAAAHGAGHARLKARRL